MPKLYDWDAPDPDEDEYEDYEWDEDEEDEEDQLEPYYEYDEDRYGPRSSNDDTLDIPKPSPPIEGDDWGDSCRSQ